MASYLITGCSRGFGLALASKLASLPSSQVGVVFASARSNTSTALQDLVKSSSGRVVFVELDVTSKDSIKGAFNVVESSLDGRGLDVLVNNAGVLSWTPNGIENMTDLESTFSTNVTSVHNVTSTFLPLLTKGSKKLIANISTTLGSFGWSEKFAAYPIPSYKISKAALNMLTVQYAYSFANKGFTFIAVSPGWLKTDLGTEQADLTPAEGAKAVVDVLVKVDGDHDANGKFFSIHVPGWENNPGVNQYAGGFEPW